ncbi:glycoside hydrolase family 3 C-terminal domain-containing protein [Mycobacterium yunnanensis]|uniref:Exo-alpha-(1->6)-L-arabinopyranosidase n=2 Tax=Mycobacterium yunnanensis TaxID=368477 RepID=A0A9X2YXL3_9MYCO|nr:glycoside hydrolase family 3 C-terminal domain-containing protein [Mycobacterium yunnanensis]MCV7420318.1 glycoside hydrolase family 3 C-terminal domain-containing protein [Mycobacterium yunnanensis]
MTSQEIDSLTIEEKAALLSGADFWHTAALEGHGVPSIMMTDGPHGLRKQRGSGDHLGLGDSVPATCFPPAVAMGSSWDVDLIRRVGEAIGTEAVIEDVGVVLGPGVNIKRSPLCGRNFEYFSEDPIVAGVLGAAMVDGIQSRGVGASLKHFAVNNQETDRMRVSAEVDPRPLREIYLRAFGRVVTDARPWTVMCSYNRVNGVYASEDRWLLTTVLREEWGFDGVVVSDWGAVDDRVRALAAGLDLEMPGSRGVSTAQLLAAVADGSLDESALDVAAARVWALVERTGARAPVSGPLDVDAHHALAREAAGRSIVLLKNDGGLLPLSPDADIAVIGAFAADPRYQGAGSSMINPTRLDRAVDEIRAMATGSVTYAAGFDTAVDVAESDAARLLDEAVAAASGAEVAVVFLGLPARLESEGYDRDDVDLPANQLAVLQAVVDANSNTVVVLSNGGVVTLSFAANVPAILEGWLLGQAGGGATADVLFGVVNPSAKLTETIPLRFADSPAYLDFPGEFSRVRYGEGLFVGYRWYDARDLDVAHPFGHGLSYTTFEYGPASASTAAGGDVEVSLTVTNTGPVAGREIVQLYSSLPTATTQRPPRELKAFAAVPLEPGQTREVVLVVRRTDLAYWDVRVDSWVVEGGTYSFDVAASSRDVRSTVRVEVAGDPVAVPLSRTSSIGEVLADPAAGPILRAAMAEMMGDAPAAMMPEGVDLSKLLDSFPIGRVAMFGADVDPAMVDALLAARPSDDAET